MAVLARALCHNDASIGDHQMPFGRDDEDLPRRKQLAIDGRAARQRLGAVVDLSSVEHEALQRYTQDAGNHVSFEVRPAATLTLSD